MSTISQNHTFAYQPDLQPIASRLAPFGHLAWLTSSGRRGGRYDILTAAPDSTVSYDGGTLQLDGAAIRTNDPLSAIAAQRRVAIEPDLGTLPFTGGFIGFLGYPLHATLERHHIAPPDPTGMPMLCGGFYSWALVADHQTRTLNLVGEPPGREIETAIRAGQDATGRYALASPFRSTMSEAAYHTAFDTLKTHILDGDCYQVNLARHFQARACGDPLALLRDFKRLQGASYGALLQYPQGAVLSVSPERFAYGRGRRVSTWPIKGTAPRNATPEVDRSLAQALIRSPKNRAENLMIVDLLRNDLGRVCTIGSVHVDALCHNTRHANVHHLQSVVSGELQDGIGPWQTLAALFPCGSITGAPKIQAIDIINELEPVGRSAYCGAVGYIDERSGRFDFNVAIRTAVMADKSLHVWGGGGIVADSDPTDELNEIDAKIGRLLRGLDQLR